MKKKQHKPAEGLDYIEDVFYRNIVDTAFKKETEDILSEGAAAIYIESEAHIKDIVIEIVGILREKARIPNFWRDKTSEVRKLEGTIDDRLEFSGIPALSGKHEKICAEILKLAEGGHESARLALDVFCYRLKKYIGAYMAVLGTVDALVFTAGIGENQPGVRAGACAGIERLGFVLDEAKNERAAGVEADISTPEAATRILVIPTNEEKLIAMDTARLASGE